MNVYIVRKFIQTKLIKNEVNGKSFLIMISINLLCCKEKVFILMNLWMIGKHLIIHHYVKKEKSYVNFNLETITNSD